MGRLRRQGFAILFLLFSAALQTACGMGGTEVGNPRPGIPAEAPGDETDPTFGPEAPSPTPSVLQFDEADLD